MSQNPLFLILRAAKLWLTGRVHFWSRRLRHDPTTLHVGDERFVAFRKVAVDSRVAQPAATGALFLVRFRFRNLSPAANRRLSLIPIPLIVAQPGFRSKTWLLGECSGDFVGLYEFDSVESAEAYWDSLPLRMMRRRAAPGSLSHEVRAVTADTTRIDDTQCTELAQ